MIDTNEYLQQNLIRAIKKHIRHQHQLPQRSQDELTGEATFTLGLEGMKEPLPAEALSASLCGVSPLPGASENLKALPGSK